MAERICVAQIGAAHGMRGEVQALSRSPPIRWRSRDYGPLETEDGTRDFEIETLRPAKGHLVARFAGVARPQRGRARCATSSFTCRATACRQPETDEFYHADLIGLAAVDARRRRSSAPWWRSTISAPAT